MAVSDVVNRLSQRPSAIAIRCVELFVGKTVNCSGESHRQLSDRIDIPFTGEEVSGVEFANRVSRISVHYFCLKQLQPVRPRATRLNAGLQDGSKIERQWR